MDARARAVLKPQLVLREEFDDWAILFNPDNGKAFGLNPVGVFVCRRLDGTRTVSDIVAQLSEEFSDEAAAQKDVPAFVDFLVRLNLASIKEPA
jgi:SynChlorMet cassette protein ScmD